MLSVRCPVCLSCLCLSVCNVRALWPNCWTDQYETWHAGRHWPWPHCVRWDPAPSPKGAQPPIFDPYLLRPNGCMDQDVTWCRSPMVQFVFVGQNISGRVWRYVYVVCGHYCLLCAAATSARSAVYKISRRGPRTEPCGTEQTIMTTDDVYIPPNTT